MMRAVAQIGIGRRQSEGQEGGQNVCGSSFPLFSVQFLSQGELRCRKLIRNRKGQGLVEYALIIAGVTLIAAVGISVFGHKVSDLIAAVAAILPGAHTDDNGPIVSGQFDRNDRLTRTAAITIDAATIASSIERQDRLGRTSLAQPTVPKTASMAW